MNRKLQTALFATNFAIFVTGMGLLPVLPLYAAEFGASRTVIGLYLATTYAAIAAGAMVTNRLLSFFPLKPLFAVSGIIGVPALIVLGQARSLGQVIALTALIWFVGGIGLALVMVLTGLYADGRSRGKSFGLMFLARPLAGVLGGLAVGQVIANQGYPQTFVMLAAIWLLWPLATLGLDRALPTPARKKAVTFPRKRMQKRPFYLLLLVVFLSTVAIYVGRLSTTLAMQTLSYDARAISSTAVIASLVAIPVTPLLGSLSDRLGRRRLLWLGYGLAALGALILVYSTQLWQFWLETVLLFIATSVNGAVATALATDMLPADQVRRYLPWLNAAVWVAGIAGFAASGLVADVLGVAAAGWIAAALSLIAGALLLPRPQFKRKATAVESLAPIPQTAPCN